MYLAISNKGGIKRMRKEVIMIWVHKTCNKQRLNVKNVKDFKSPKKRCSMGKIFSSTKLMTLTKRFCR